MKCQLRCGLSSKGCDKYQNNGTSAFTCYAQVVLGMTAAAASTNNLKKKKIEYYGRMLLLTICISISLVDISLNVIIVHLPWNISLQQLFNMRHSLLSYIGQTK